FQVSGRKRRYAGHLCEIWLVCPRQGAPAGPLDWRFVAARAWRLGGRSIMPCAGARMHAIQSADGTPIRYFRRGHGPAILLIHGTAADHSRWVPVVTALQRHFTVCAMDRRGRGGSGDAVTYRMEDEFADIAAIVADIESGPVNVVGHSYGGICAMESVLRNASIRRLVLYEPPIAVLQGAQKASEAIANVRRRITEGDREGALEYFYGRIAQIP